MAGASETGAEADAPHIHNPRFARRYERLSQRRSEQALMEPLRRELIEQAHDLVLEVGVGTGLNFPFYRPEKVTRLEAVEPDATMLSYARTHLSQARVPVNLTQAPVETLPFADSFFDCVVVTLVFCSVHDPLQGLREIQRVLRPGGTLLLLEHVRSQGRLTARLQDLLVPLTTRLVGNCHWNRETGQSVRKAGFQVQQERRQQGWLLPMILLHAKKKDAL